MAGRLRRLLLGLALLCAGPIAAGAEETPAPAVGTIAGVVLDAVSGDPIIEAGVELLGAGRTVRTDLDGRYRIEAAAGTHRLRVFAPLYRGVRLENVVVRAGAVTKADATLAPASGQAGVDVVEVIAQADRAAEATQLLQRRKAAVVSDTISAEMIRKTPASDAADVVQRAPAVTVQDEKFLFVRGLSERYTSALVEGSRLPSTDPQRRVVPLDLFPADFLESLAIIKSYTPDLPGDFSGGLADLRLRDFPEKPSFGLGLSTGANTQTTFGRVATYRGGPADAFGFGAHARRLPGIVPDEPGPLAGERAFAIGRAFRNVWQTREATAPPNAGLNVSAGNTFGPLGVQLAGTYQNEHKRRSEVQRQFRQGNTATGEARFVLQEDFRYDVSTFQTRLGGLLNSALKLSDAHQLAVRGLVNRNSYDETQLARGQTGNLGIDQGFVQEQTRLRYTEEELALGQLAGQHRFPWLHLDWRTAFAHTTQDEPDMRHLTYQGPADQPLEFVNDSSGGLRVFNTLDELMTDSALDLTVPFRTALPFTDAWSGLPARLKLGPAYTYRDRDFLQRRFRYTIPQVGGVDFTLPPEEILQPGNIGPGGLGFEEQTVPKDAFQATHEILAGYGMLDLPLVRDRLRLVAGVRMEYSLIRLAAFDDQGNPLAPRKKNVDPLPGANLVYSPREDMNLRLGYSRSAARPEFRELSPVQYPAPRGLRPLIGNPDLVQTDIESWDFRWEWFPSPLEVLSVSLFYKQLERPIEQVVIDLASGIADSFANAEAGEILGFECEGRKHLGFLGPRFRHLSVLANFTWAQSSVTAPRTSRTQVQTTTERELQGQAPFIANGALDWTHPRWGSARLLYNTAERRIATAGAFGLPDIFEERRDQLDAVVVVPLRDLLGVPLTWKLSAENLFNHPAVFTQGDQVQRRFTTGVKFSMGLSYAF
jgi:hypothetical protein